MASKPKIERLSDNYRPSEREIVRFKQCGNISEIMYMEHRNTQISIRKVSDTEYIDLRQPTDEETGEIILHQFQRSENRADNKAGVARSLALGRDLINTNVTDVNNVRWITLTYAENMTDPKRLYEDFKKFNMRLRYALGEHYEYIVAMEPQGRGSWHAHMLMIFDHKAPYIPNETIATAWKQGFVTVKKLDDVDNVGAYLTAYLGDMDLDECPINCIGKEVKEVEITDENGNKKSKFFIKGARLHLYPPKFNMFRYSRGIKKPSVELMSNQRAEKKVSGATLTFEKTLKLSNGGETVKEFSTHINYRYYNTKR